MCRINVLYVFVTTCFVYVYKKCILSYVCVNVFCMFTYVFICFWMSRLYTFVYTCRCLRF